MNKRFFEKNLSSLLFQRNLLLIIALLLMGGNLLLSSFLFLKNERIVVVPAIVEKEFWVDNNHISATYLEQFGYFLGQLLLNKSAVSAPQNREILFRHTDPSYIGQLKKHLIEEEEILRKQNAAFVFFLSQISVDTQHMIVKLTGEKQLFVSGKKVSSEQSHYHLHFVYVSGRLLLKEISSEVLK
jgi:conjugal transfer pilus assembly protein TraE